MVELISESNALRCTCYTQAAEESDAESFQDPRSEQGWGLQTPLSNHGTCCFLALRSVEVIISGLGGWVETLRALSVGIQLKASPKSPAAPVFVSRCLPFMLEQGRA